MKKQKTVMIILCWALAFICTVSTFAVSTGENVGTVPGTTQTITLDGEKDTVYADGLILDGSLVQGEDYNGSASATYYVVYTSDALWVYCEIADSDIVVANEDETMPSYKVDSIEIMLDVENSGLNEDEVTPLQMRIDSFNLVSARKGQKGTRLYLRTDEGGNCDFFDAQSVKTANGFNAEYRIPLSGLTAGKQIGFNFCYNDWDELGSSRIVIGTDKNVTSWDVGLYQYFTLGETIAETTEVPAVEGDLVEDITAEEEIIEEVTVTEETAPATGDTGIIVAVAVMAITSGIVLSKKH